MRIPRFSIYLLLIACVVAVAPAPAQDDEEELGWSDTAELSFVVTEGNSNQQTLGFSNELRRRWKPSVFVFKLGGVKAENTTITRIAIGPDAQNFFVQETEDTETTAEQFYGEARYNHKISDRLYWFGAGRYESNRPAGIDKRALIFGGVGNIWYDKEKIKLTTDYSVSYTDQTDVIQPPDVDTSFAGMRLTLYYNHKLTKSTMFTNETAADLDLEETSNWRGNMLNSVTVAISERLALKASLRWLYENQPALQAVDLFAPPFDPDADPDPIGTALVPVDELDTIFMTSLVVNF